MTMKSLLMLSVLLLWAANGGAGEIRPQGVSPGAGGPVSLIESRCPTFSWSLVPGAQAYELAVFEVSPELLEGDLSDPQTGEPRFRVRLPEMAVSWTPSVGQCLAPGGQYAWFVRALGDEWSEWSEAKVFEVARGPPSPRWRRPCGCCDTTPGLGRMLSGGRRRRRSQTGGGSGRLGAEG